MKKLTLPWVNVKDGLPDADLDVLVGFKRRVGGLYEYAIAYRDDEADWYSTETQSLITSPDYWMDLRGREPL